MKFKKKDKIAFTNCYKKKVLLVNNSKKKSLSNEN